MHRVFFVPQELPTALYKALKPNEMSTQIQRLIRRESCDKIYGSDLDEKRKERLAELDAGLRETYLDAEALMNKHSLTPTAAAKALRAFRDSHGLTTKGFRTCQEMHYALVQGLVARPELIYGMQFIQEIGK